MTSLANLLIAQYNYNIQKHFFYAKIWQNATTGSWYNTTMEQRRNLKREEEKIISLLTADVVDARAVESWAKVLDYFRTKDALEGSHHLSIISSVYSASNRNRETLQSVATKNHVGERTFYRYREKYIECFYYFYGNRTEGRVN